MARAFLDRTHRHRALRGRAPTRSRPCASSSPRVHAAPYTTAQFPADNHFGAEVRVALRGGKVLSGKVDQPFGRTSDNPLPAALLKEKFDNCARRVLPAERVGRALLGDTGLREPEGRARGDGDHRGRRRPRTGGGGVAAAVRRDAVAFSRTRPSRDARPLNRSRHAHLRAGGGRDGIAHRAAPRPLHSNQPGTADGGEAMAQANGGTVTLLFWGRCG